MRRIEALALSFVLRSIARPRLDPDRQIQLSDGNCKVTFNINRECLER